MSADKVFDGEHDWHGAGRAGEQGADDGGAVLPCAPAAEDAGEHVVIGEEDLFARLRRNPGIDEGAGGLFVVAHDGDVQFKELGGERIVADHGGDLGGRNLGFRKKGVGVEPQGDTFDDAAKHAARKGGVAVQAWLCRVEEFVVDIFAVLEDLLVVARDEGIFVSGLAGSLGDANRSAGWARKRSCAVVRVYHVGMPPLPYG